MRLRGGRRMNRFTAFSAQREFYGLTLGMSPDTLEPRPDSEMIVEGLIPFAQKFVAEKGSCHLIDLGHRHRGDLPGAA